MAFENPTLRQLSDRYTFYVPKSDQIGRYEMISAAVLGVAQIIVKETPCSPEQTRALNALDEAMMLANAAIARNE